MKHDKELIRKRFSRSLAAYDSIAVVQKDIAARLADTVALHKKEAATGIEIGAGTGFLTHRLLETYPAARWTVNDIVPESAHYIGRREGMTFVTADGEHMPLGTENDIIASASTVQWFDSLPEFIARAAGALAEDGILALSTFGPDNFREITAATGNSLEYFPAGELEKWARDAGLEIVGSEEWHEIRHFDTPLDVLRHIKATGVNALDKQRWTHARLRRFETEYRELSGEVTLTFHPIIMVARKK